MEPPKLAEISGVWIGYQQGDLEFTRLDLRPDGSGYCARVSPNDSTLHEYGVEGYRITHWSITTNWNLNIRLVAATTNAESIYLKGNYYGHSFDLETGGSNGEWSRKITLHRESAMNIANDETRTVIQQIEER